MHEHRYNKEQRFQQLSELRLALRDLIGVVSVLPSFAHLKSAYEAALADVENLQLHGFEQEHLSALSRAIPDAFHRHKEWIPPLERDAIGTLIEPEWFLSLESKLQPVLSKARVLRELGYY